MTCVYVLKTTKTQSELFVVLKAKQKNIETIREF